MEREEIEAAVTAGLRSSGRNAHRAALDAGLPQDAIRNVLDGHTPSAIRLSKICEALGLEFYVGPARPAADASALSPASLGALQSSAQALLRVVLEQGGNPIPDDLWPALVAGRGIPAPASVDDPDALLVEAANEDDLPPGARSMGAREIEVAAGGGAVNLDEAPEKGRVFFRRDWLDRHGIDPTQCVVIGVRGESMEPTLTNGCSILVDRARTRRRDGGIFVLNTEEGLIVKRLGKRGRRWQLVSDHPSWKSAPWPRDAQVIGEVRWASRTFG